MLVNLEPLREDFPDLIKILPKINLAIIASIPKRETIISDCSDVVYGLSELFTIISFSKHSEIYEWKIDKKYVKATIDWLGSHNSEDARLICICMGITENREIIKIDDILYNLYSELDDQYIEEECRSCK